MAKTALLGLAAAMSLLLLIQVAAAATLENARPVIQCYRCIPNENNRYCADEFVDDNTVDCTSGRCLMMGAEFARQNDVARMYDCDNHNIVDYAFQVLANNADTLADNTCQLVDFKNPSVIDAFRNYGLSQDLNSLLRGAISSSNNVDGSVNIVEMCTCSSSLCDSADGNAKISLIKARNRAPPPPPPTTPAPPSGGLAWWWIVIIILSVLTLLIALAALGLWLYKRSQEDAARPHYAGPDHVPENNPRIVRR